MMVLNNSWYPITKNSVIIMSDNKKINKNVTLIHATLYR